MSRVQIDMPETYSFATDIPVRITDLNYGNHVGHDTIMSILHEARVRMLDSKGFSEIDIGGCGLIMTDTAIVFKNEVFYPALLRCKLAVGNVSRSRFDVFYRVTRKGDDDVVAEAKTGMVCFDYEQKRIARMPTSFKAAFSDAD